MITLMFEITAVIGWVLRLFPERAFPERHFSERIFPELLNKVHLSRNDICHNVNIQKTAVFPNSCVPDFTRKKLSYSFCTTVFIAFLENN